MRIKVYSTNSCPWCVRVKEWLNEHNIKFEEINVERDQKAAQEMIIRSGQEGVPVIDVDGEIIIGFDINKLKKLLKIE
ncbi:MAG: glutathione S-transferase N-terminal domain-containing protein [Nanoarchaeota archaeon]|nr:glutathione S-transferase N-terminal domain-containing protein [Nanoarchaeota archaeon]